MTFCVSGHHCEPGPGQQPDHRSHPAGQSGRQTGWGRVRGKHYKLVAMKTVLDLPPLHNNAAFKILAISDFDLFWNILDFVVVASMRIWLTVKSSNCYWKPMGFGGIWYLSASILGSFMQMDLLCLLVWVPASLDWMSCPSDEQVIPVYFWWCVQNKMHWSGGWKSRGEEIFSAAMPD